MCAKPRQQGWRISSTLACTKQQGGVPSCELSVRGCAPWPFRPAVAGEPPALRAPRPRPHAPIPTATPTRTTERRSWRCRAGGGGTAAEASAPTWPSGRTARPWWRCSRQPGREARREASSGAPTGRFRRGWDFDIGRHVGPVALLLRLFLFLFRFPFRFRVLLLLGTQPLVSVRKNKKRGDEEASRGDMPAAPTEVYVPPGGCCYLQ